MGKSQITFAITVFFVLLAFPFAGQAGKKILPSVSEAIEKSLKDLYEKYPPAVFEHIDEELQRSLPNETLEEALDLKQGRDYLKIGKARKALKYFQCPQKNCYLKEYFDYYRSLALKKLKKYKQALELVSGSNPLERSLHWDRFWHELDLLALTKQHSTLKQKALEIQKKYSKDKWVQIKTSYFIGKSALLSGLENEAISYFQNVLVKNPGTYHDHRIFYFLKRFDIPKSRVLTEALWNQRAEMLIESGYAHVARRIYEKYAEKDPKRYKERIAYATFRERNYPKAAKLYEDILKTGHFAGSELQTLVRLAQAYVRHDNFQGAFQVYEKILKKYPRSRTAQNMKFKKGFLYFDSGQYEKAIRYLKPFEKKGSHRQREQARWYRFWSYYLTKQFDDALKLAEDLLQTRDREQKQIMTYWVARIYDHLGQKKNAKQYYQQASSQGPSEYYSTLAAQRLRLKKLHPKTILDERMFASLPKIKNQKRLQKFHGQNVIKSILLYRANLDNYAFDESQKMTNGVSAPPSFSFVRSFQLGGNYYYSYKVRKQALRRRISNCGQGCALQISYPRAYQKYMTPYAHHWKIDDCLAYGIMRQESVFKPEALSWAYAYGLMQMIPPTGEEVAEKIGYSNFHITLLNRPEINILFGTFYISDLLSQFQQNPVLAIAGYNAGPDAVGRWYKKLKKEDLDVFVELIPYSQTRDYVKKVLVNYLTYKSLYHINN